MDLTDQFQLALTLKMHTGQSGYPNLYIGEDHIGGVEDFICFLKERKTLSTILKEQHIEHDLDHALTLYYKSEDS